MALQDNLRFWLFAADGLATPAGAATPTATTGLTLPTLVEPGGADDPYLDFDGGDGVSYDDGSNTMFTIPTDGAYTFAIKFRIDVDDNNPVIFSTDPFGGFDKGMELQVQSVASHLTRFRDAGSNSVYVQPPAYTEGTDVVYVFTRSADDTELKCYDASGSELTLIGVGDLATRLFNGQKLVFGSAPNGTAPLDGRVYWCVGWDRELTPTELANNINLADLSAATAALTLPSITTVSGDDVAAPGESAAIVGSNFGASQGTGTVIISPADDIDDVNAVTQTVTAWGATSITFTVNFTGTGLSPTNTAYLFVTNDDGDVNAAGHAFTYADVRPTLTSVGGDNDIADGEPSTIVGTNFGGTQGSGRVVISPADDVDDASAVEQLVTTWGATSIVFVADFDGTGVAVDGTAYVFVENGAGDTNAAGRAITRAAPVPTVTSIGTDNVVDDAESVSITGINFGSTQGTGVVIISPTNNIADAAATEQTVTAWGDNAITITVGFDGTTIADGQNGFVFVVDDGAIASSGFQFARSGSPAFITLPALKNNAGSVLASQSSIIANVYLAATGELIKRRTGLSTDAQGVIAPFSDSAFVEGASYFVVLEMATGARGLSEEIQATSA